MVEILKSEISNKYLNRWTKMKFTDIETQTSLPGYDVGQIFKKTYINRLSK